MKTHFDMTQIFDKEHEKMDKDSLHESLSSSHESFVESLPVHMECTSHSSSVDDERMSGMVENEASITDIIHDHDSP